MSFSFASTSQNEEAAPPKRKASRAAMHVEPESSTVGVHGSMSGYALQRKAGCACGGGCPRCQAKPHAHGLDVSQPGDTLELEADRVAERVMRMPAHIAESAETVGRRQASPATLQRKCGACEEEDARPLARKAPHDSAVPETTHAAPLVRQALGSLGQPLDTTTRRFFETRFGRDFGEVRIHHDTGAAESAQAVSAQAYTVGHNVVFGQGQYRPQTDEGKLLLAHELAHVVQQGAHGSRLQRKDDKAKAAPKTKPKPVFPATAGDSPKLIPDKLTSGTPCACLMVIHNNEQNARRTARSMRNHCAYNLLLLEPDDHEREIALAGHSRTIDPNELFTKKVAGDCVTDEKQCEDFVKNNSGSADKAVVEEVVGKQFYLEISKCSNKFALPVIALHNNVIEDTEKYRQKIKTGTSVTGLKKDIDKTDPVAGAQQVKELKDLIDTKFGTDKVNIVKIKDKPDKTFTIREYLMDVKGKTNIFRWCGADPLTKCHIGDPEHPDNVVWVTNEADYAKLRTKDVNVALQTDLSKVLGTDAESDLSTLFLFIKKIKGDLLSKQAAALIKLIKDMLIKIDADKQALIDSALAGKISVSELVSGTSKLSQDLGKVLTQQALLIDANNAIAALGGLRFINIETQEKFPGKKPEEVRVESYDSIINVLKTVGLHCCGDAAATAKAETDIREELKK